MPRMGTNLGSTSTRAIIRRNILTNSAVRDAYVRGVLLLKQQEIALPDVRLQHPRPGGAGPNL